MKQHSTRFRFTRVRILALLVALIAIAVILRSQRTSDWLAYYHDSGAWGLQTFRGDFYLGTSTAWSLPTHEQPGGWRYATVEPEAIDGKYWRALAALPYSMSETSYLRTSEFHVIGVTFKRGFTAGAPTDWLLIIPLWLFIVPLAFVLLLSLRRRIRRLRLGLCLGCGYAVQSAAVCPECGTPRRTG